MEKLDNELLYLSQQDIFEYLKNRPPLLMIEDAYVKPGEYAYSERVLDEDEWFFKCHFPGDPMMPGVLQLESMFNTAALPIKVLDGNKEKTTNISDVKNVRYRRHIRPGDKIRIEVKLNKHRRGLAFMEGRITSENEMCCEAEFVLVTLDEVLGVE